MSADDYTKARERHVKIWGRWNVAGGVAVALCSWLFGNLSPWYAIPLGTVFFFMVSQPPGYGVGESKSRGRP